MSKELKSSAAKEAQYLAYKGKLKELLTKTKLYKSYGEALQALWDMKSIPQSTAFHGVPLDYAEAILKELSLVEMSADKSGDKHIDVDLARDKPDLRVFTITTTTEYTGHSVEDAMMKGLTDWRYRKVIKATVVATRPANMEKFSE